MKALIKVGYGCNENCTFCHTDDMRQLEDTAERVDRKIDRARDLGYSMVVLSGGEPTIRPELLRWARRVAAHGLDLGLVTNGLLLAYPHVTDELLSRCRLRYVYMSLHGGEAKVHASLVRADTFHKAIAALENLHGRVPELTVNCVVTTANVRHLRGLVDRLLPMEQLTIKFSMTQPKGAANRVFDVVIPTVTECAARVADAIEYGLARRTAAGPSFVHDGIPFCLLPGLEDRYSDLKTHRYAAMIETDEDDYVPVDDVAKVHPSACRECSIKGACPGLYRGYWEAHGEGELRPVLGRPRANSYNFTPERDYPRAPGAPCPIKADGPSPYDRGRTLFVRLKDRMRLFRSETRDFSDAELLHTKEGASQLYLDVSTKLAPDDFARDLRKLRLASECRACPLRAECTGCWIPMREDVFSADDALLRERLRALVGRVLDVGCGEGVYVEELAPSARAGKVEYLGLDPDGARVAALASRHPFARFQVGRAEELGPDVGEIDHALVLRSYNHLEDPASAIGRIVGRLRPGGTLTIADNVAFGLVRSRGHARRAEQAKENRFEHFRNADAADALAVLERHPLRLLERRDVGLDTSNQWMVRLEKTGEGA